MGKWLFRKDSPRADATPDYKCKEILMPEKTKKTVKELYEEWLDGYIAAGGEVRITARNMGDPLFSKKSCTFYVVKEDSVIPVNAGYDETFIIEKGVYVHVEEGCKTHICYMEDFSSENENYVAMVYGDNPQYAASYKETERVRLEKEAKAGQMLRLAIETEKKQFLAFLKKTRTTRDLGVCTKKDYNWPKTCDYQFDGKWSMAHPKAITISHLPKKTTICSGDKNYSMTIYVTPQAYLKIEKDTGTGTIITVSDEVAAALVGDK